mmetsp:Transcript_12853/g.14713  ORF Transcript_12853/g.14713 Transcript_12853/m.14713 type:complete len:218 (+) Transcript_12853:1206-1859(+)
MSSSSFFVVFGFFLRFLSAVGLLISSTFLIESSSLTLLLGVVASVGVIVPAVIFSMISIPASAAATVTEESSFVLVLSVLSSSSSSIAVLFVILSSLLLSLLQLLIISTLLLLPPITILLLLLEGSAFNISSLFSFIRVIIAGVISFGETDIFESVACSIIPIPAASAVAVMENEESSFVLSIFSGIIFSFFIVLRTISLTTATSVSATKLSASPPC